MQVLAAADNSWMPYWVIATGAGFYGVLAARRVVLDLRRGISSSYVHTYYCDEEPIGYTLCLLSWIGIVVLCSAIVLHAFGLVGEPITAINAALPPFLRCTQSACL